MGAWRIPGLSCCSARLLAPKTCCLPLPLAVPFNSPRMLELVSPFIHIVDVQAYIQCIPNMLAA